jgi:thiopurine S-methyltransferase
MSSEDDPSLREPNANWLQRWETQKIGWHHEEFNPHLLNYWPALNIPINGLVLAPLCGKSRDLVWLVERGYRVRGVELSPLAVAQFFQEQGLEALRQVHGSFELWSAGPYELYCGDIFDLAELDNSQVAAVYDRASLVALNPDQRKRYAELLLSCLPQTCPTLLVAMDYPQQEMAGPPYSVAEEEVRAHYQRHYRVTLLHSLNLLQETPRYGDRGLSRMTEEIYQLSPIYHDGT